MDLTQQSKQHVEQVARDALDQFDKVATAAQTAIRNAPNLGTDALAAVNTLTGGAAVQRLGQINQENLESYQILAREPAIARVAVLDEEGRQRVYYICRTTPITGVSNLASYRAPVGRLASLPVGTEFSLPNGDVVEVVERAQLRPSHLAEGWDSRDTIIEADDLGPFTIESLRSLLYKVAGEEVTEDLLEQLLAEESETANIIEGVRRSVITKMGLRDQPILDQYQDEIFRLPLDQRLLILGPPGTGKTTTLIRRLGQKLDSTYLEEGELRAVESISSATGVSHANTDSGVTLPAHVDNEGVPPTLLENAAEQDEVVDWLAQRIREIEQFLEQMPSIAIFVESEAEVQPLADALNEALAAENAQVVACPKGQVMGQDNDVRVFDVQHIKGLEFEAVFFVGVDRLATIHPQLFDKYLYVGTTRAATYLGWTCDSALPDKISTLRPMFIANW